MRIIIILAIIIFTGISCSENQSGTTKAVTLELDNEKKTDTLKVNIETFDSLHTNNYPEEEFPTTYIKDLELFWIRDLEENANKKVGFISLSDIYPLSEHPDSLAIPNIENVDNQHFQYFILNSTFRKRLLSKTNILETDSVFIYDYSTDALMSLSVKELNVVAYLNIYMDIKDCPCNQYDYMIGFEVTKSNLNGIGKYFGNALVFIGKENPFTRGEMQAIVWQKIKSEKFPSEKSNLPKTQKQFIHKNSIKGQAYQYEADNFHVFIQDFTEPNNFSQVENRHLIVIDKLTGNVVNEIMFHNGESSSIAPLNFGINNSNFSDLKQQWMGKLLKDNPEVIFGFKYVSFGCPIINFINSKDNYIEINCDNRH